MKKILSIFLCGALLFSLAACDNGADADSSSKVSSKPTESNDANTSSTFQVPTSNNYEEITYPLAETTDYFYVTGRTDVVTTTLETGELPGLLYDHAAQGFFFNADCEGDVSVELCLFIKSSDGAPEQYYTVYVDGVKQEYVTATGIYNVEMIVTLPIAKDLPRGRHTFEIYRNHESLLGYATLLNVTMKGVPEKWVKDEDQLKIEFLGDSITSGSGVNAVNKTESQNDKKNSNATLSYAFIAADILNAEASIVSRSGMTCAGDAAPNMYKYYNNLSYDRYKERAYDHSKMDIDLYVISLGTNDNNNSYNYTDQQLSDNVKAALTAVRKDHPDVKILWVYGQLNNERANVIETAVQEAGGEANGFYYYCCTQPNFAGGHYHPNAAAQKRDGEEVAEVIKQILGLK